MLKLAPRALVALLAFVSLGGCDEEEFFRACPLSQRIVDVCEAESTSTAITCVVEDHPLCDEKVCASWKDSEPFCSRTCNVNADCPEGSTCEVYLDFAFCVPAEALPEAVVNP